MSEEDKKDKKKTALKVELNLAGLLGGKDVDRTLKLEFNPQKMTKGALAAMQGFLKQAQDVVEEHIQKLDEEENTEETSAESAAEEDNSTKNTE